MSNKRKHEKTSRQQRIDRARGLGLASLLNPELSGQFQGIDFSTTKKARKFAAYLVRTFV